MTENDNISSKQLLEELSFCVLDLETTGGNHDNDKIIEIGMVRIQKLGLTEECNSLINPEMSIPDFIQKLTSIKQKDVKNSPTIEDKIDEILDFIGDDIIVAHNTSFDVPFLNSVLRRLGREELKNKVICTNVMTKHMIPEIMNSNLNYMSKLFGISHEKAHRASDDARATAKLLLIYLDIFIEKGLKKVNQLYYPKNKFELDRLHYSFDHDRNEILEKIKMNNTSMIITLKGERGLILGTLPVQNPSEEIEFIEKFINCTEWTILSIKLLKPMLEGLFQFSNHYLKYPEEIRIMLHDYLTTRYVKKTEIPTEFSVENLDFVVSHHLVADQLIVYSFLHLNTNIKPIFKFPAQKKKMLQFMTSQVKRFDGAQNGRRHNLLHKDLVPLIESFLVSNSSTGDYKFISRKEVKEAKEKIFSTLEPFVQGSNKTYLYPQNHI